MKLWVCILIIASLSMMGCGTNTVTDRPEVGNVGLLEKYDLGVGDHLAITVWKNPDLSVSVPVRPDGKISIPLVGDVAAAGLTAEELSNSIGKALETYVRGPKVTVIVTNPASADFQHRVRIVGAVQSPQSSPYRNGMTVLDLVLMGGGLNEFASPNKTKLYRKIDGVVKAYPVYLDDILNKGNLDSNYSLIPSDIVTVPERSF